MSSPSDPPTPLYDLVVRAVIAFERDGDVALARELAAAGDLADQVREHVDSMRQSGLLQAPEKPERIGPLRVLQRLGSGGMGTVFLCEQLEPVRRRVAVKVMRSGLDSAAVLARFRLEQKALAALDHPGIARLFDAGSTDDGRPFLVMEYVAGVPLTRYCDERQLDGPGRLELFARICDAVQHAHHKGLVHRDLKPTNVLVLDRDGAPWPVVIDFGVAKSAGPTPGEGTLLTLPGMMLGTPEYMAPEQATHELDVDTRADVYSLGVMLYELLTGTLPIARERLRGGDVAQVLGSTEPPTPSARITSLGDTANTIAGNRRTDVAGLRRLVRGDLDWVVMKALEKDRNRRYGMPAELAADVRRFLADEPVSAGPVSRWYRLRKLCARNRVSTLAIAATLLTVAAGLVTSTWFWRDAVASSRASSASLEDALSAVGELVAVGDSDLVDVPHLTAVRRGLLERSVAFYRRFLDRAESTDAAEPRLLPRVVEAQLRLGCLQAHLGEHQTALATLSAGEALAASLPAHSIDITVRARALDALAATAEHTGNTTKALTAARTAENLLRAAFAGAADDDTRTWLVRTLLRRGRQLAPKDRDQALALTTEAKDLCQAFATDAGRIAMWPLVIEAGADCARRRIELGQRAAARDELEAAFALWQRAQATAPEASIGWRLTLAVGEVAALFAQCDTYTRMIPVLAAAEAAYDRLVHDHPSVLDYRSRLAHTRLHKGLAMMRSHAIADGIAAMIRAEADYSEALALAPNDPTLLQDAAHAAIQVANGQLESRTQQTGFDRDLAAAARERALVRIEALAPLPTGGRAARSLRLEERRVFALLHPTPGGAEATAALAEAAALADELVATEPANHALRDRKIEMHLRHAQALRQGGDAAGARAELLAIVDEQAAMRDISQSENTWILRRQRLLSELAHAEARLGDAEATIVRLRERLATANDEDWGGKLEVARLVLQFAGGELAGAAPQLLAFGREVVQLALAAGDHFAPRADPNIAPSMIAAMRANTWSLLVDIERKAGDARAEAAALGEVAACRAAACATSSSERNISQLRSANDAWLQRLAAIGEAPALAAAAARIGTWSANDAPALLAAARVLAAFVGTQAGAADVMAAGRRLLELARAAGAEASALTGMDLQALSDDRD